MPFDPACSVSSLAPLPDLPTITDTTVPEVPEASQLCEPAPFPPPEGDGPEFCYEVELAEPATNHYENIPVTELRSVNVTNVDVSQSGSLQRCQVSFDFIWG